MGWNRRLVGQLQASALVLKNHSFAKIQKLMLNFNDWTLPDTGNKDLLEVRGTGTFRNSVE